jgi:SAM-dependent methyltransferase
MNYPLCLSNRTCAFAGWPEFTVKQCSDCGFRFVDTSAPQYPRDAQFTYDEPEIGAIRPELPHIQRRVRDVLRYAQPPGRALDIGCGKGELALALHERGFECAGIDMKPNIIAHLQARFPQIAWRCAPTADLAAMPGRFDVLTMYHVLEHISEPKAALRAVKALANPGALIVIEVPHIGGWEARWKGPHWHYYKVDHVNYFRTSDLLRLAADLDLTVLGVRGYQHFSYPQNVLWKDLVKGVLGWIGFQDVISVFLRVP